MKRFWVTVFVVSLAGNVFVGIVAVSALMHRAYINRWLDLYSRVSEEYSQRSVYRDADSALQSDTVVPGRVIVFGNGQFPEKDQQALFGGTEVIDRVIDSQHVVGLPLRFRQDVIYLAPEKTVLTLNPGEFRPGVRMDQVEDCVETIAGLARYHDIDLILTTVSQPVEGSPPGTETGYSAADSVEVFNDWLRGFAVRNDLLLVDFPGDRTDMESGDRPQLTHALFKSGGDSEN